MPDNKNHHYVPRFYLRHFTPNEKCIDLFNLQTQKLILKAPIKGQCCRDYFYGKNKDHEKSLGQAEGEIASMFRMLFELRRLPQPFTGGHLLLCFHVVTQAFRTQYAADTLDELTDGMWKEILKHDPKVAKEDLANVSIGYEDPALVALGHGMRCFPLLMDLGMGLILAPDGQEFITSDNPVVMMNRFMEWRTLGSNTGLAAKGLQIFFPICPFLTLVMYDKSVYRFGGSKSATLHLACAGDVMDLNVLQVASASKNVYFFSQAANVFKVSEKAMPYRRLRKAVVRVFAESQKTDRSSEIVQTSRQDLRTGASLQFLRTHKHAARWLEAFKKAKYQKAATVRDEQLLERFEAHDLAVETGNAKFEEMVFAVYGRHVKDGTF